MTCKLLFVCGIHMAIITDGVEKILGGSCMRRSCKLVIKLNGRIKLLSTGVLNKKGTCW